MPDNTKTGNVTQLISTCEQPNDRQARQVRSVRTNLMHDTTMQKATHDWQVAIAAAAGNAAAIRTADINFYTTKVASARAAGLTEPLTTAIQALRSLNATLPTCKADMPFCAAHVCF